jgi:diguanylate cyclase (GGDEF)-like protein
MLTKNRFATLISVLLITGFLATSLVSYMTSLTLLKRGLAESILPLTGDNIYSEIQKDLIRPIFIASMMASDTFLRDWVLAGEQDVGRLTRYLSEIKTKYNTITSFFVSEQTSIYYHAGGILKRIRREEPRDAWYYRVRAMKESYELNVDQDMANRDAMTIFINHRVYDYDGNYIGATGCGLSATTVTELLATYEQRYRRHIFFVNPQGIITFSTNGSSNPSSLDRIEGLRDIAPNILNKDHGSFSYERDGQLFLLDTRYVKELGWYLLVEQSLDPEMRLLRKTLAINLSLGLGIGLIILFAVQRTISHYQRRLERMAATDKLTGLFNRHSGETLFDQAIAEANRSQSPLAIMLLDIDYFKLINDRHGHQAGDLVLIVCSRLIQSNLRESDIICRWGGEEFLVVLKQCDLDAAYRLAEKIRIAVAEEVFVWGTEELSVQLSLGVVQRQPGELREHLLHRADAALYKAKHNGRNRTERGD